MQQVSLKASHRELITKGNNYRLRMAGSIPAVIYGGELKPSNVSVVDRELQHILHSSAGMNVLINLEIGNSSSNENQFVIIKDIQKDPLSGDFIHVDFYRITMDKELTTRVPVITSGIAAGVQLGGILEFVTREIEVQCLPNLIPDKIEIDVTPLGIRDSIHIADLKVPSGVKILEDKDVVVVSVVPPLKEEVVEAAPAEITEPEVIERGKKEEEEIPEGEEKKETKAAAPTPPATEKKPAEKKG